MHGTFLSFAWLFLCVSKSVMLTLLQSWPDGYNVTCISWASENKMHIKDYRGQ